MSVDSMVERLDTIESRLHRLEKVFVSFGHEISSIFERMTELEDSLDEEYVDGTEIDDRIEALEKEIKRVWGRFGSFRKAAQTNPHTTTPPAALNNS